MSDAFPCHPDQPLPAELRAWWRCPRCGTRVRGDGGAAPEYADDYPAARGHHDPEVGRCKVRTLERWLGALHLNVAGLTVCEVGFGGGACLAALRARGARVLGLEPVAANRAHARALGVPPESLFPAEPLPALPHAPELWLFQDSFEHVPDPNALCTWVARESAPRARVLLVAPDAGAPSRALMGPLWLHNVPDHRIHYSRGGVAAIFARAGFRVVRSFRPVKCISAAMVWSHLRLLAGAPRDARISRPGGLHVWFNLGELGLLLERA